jgi:hypothetical protein
MKRTLALAAALLLTACGTPPGINADVPTGVYAGVSRPVPAAVATVQEVATGPADAIEVVGISCKNKIWDPAPSAENARNLMLNKAASQGLNAVHSVTVKPISVSVIINCWQAIEARGLAFSLPAAPLSSL